MSRVVACPMCGKKLRIPEERIGQRGKCPGCGETIALIPEIQTDLPEPEPLKSGDVETEHRLRRLERQNKFLWSGIVLVLIASCAGIFTGLTTNAAEELPNQVNQGQAESNEAKAGNQKTDGGGTFFVTKRRATFDALEIKHLHLVDNSGNTRFFITVTEKDNLMMAALPPGSSLESMESGIINGPWYQFTLGAKNLSQSFSGKNGERIRISVNENEASSVIHYDQKQLMRQVSGTTKEGEFFNIVYDSKGNPVDASGSN